MGRPASSPAAAGGAEKDRRTLFVRNLAFGVTDKQARTAPGRGGTGRGRSSPFRTLAHISARALPPVLSPPSPPPTFHQLEEFFSDVGPVRACFTVKTPGAQQAGALGATIYCRGEQAAHPGPLLLARGVQENLLMLLVFFACLESLSLCWDGG